MNYIRTKDGIYEVVEADDLEIGNPTQVALSLVYKGRYFSLMENGLGDCNTVLLNETIIKESDTIEELCDGFYNDILNDFDCFGFDGLYIYNDFESFKEDWKAYRVHDNWEGNGYGFIKTSKGLIYVAKLNDKGELELI